MSGAARSHSASDAKPEEYGFGGTSPTPAALETVLEGKVAHSPSPSRRSSSQAGTPPIPIQSTDNYKMIRTIGKGNFAKVKLAVHKLTGIEVAIKIIDKTSLNESSLAKLMREVSIMKTVNHPNIVKLYEVINTKRHLFLVMEYAAGGEVFDYLVTHGRMKEKEARAKFRELVSAVEYCHKRNVIHRDLKAENLLLDKDMHIKIADFGFSNYFVPGDRLETFCGSPPYAAPELFQGKKYEGPEVDVWSLGVILYTLVSGTLPFDGTNLRELRERVIRGKYRIPFYMSTECEQLLKRFLVISPSKRTNLTDIMTDKWINTGYEDTPLTPFQPTVTDLEDEARLKQLERYFQVDSERVRSSLTSNTYDHITATYLLLDTTPSRKIPATAVAPKPRRVSMAATSPLEPSSSSSSSSSRVQSPNTIKPPNPIDRRRSSGAFNHPVSGGGSSSTASKRGSAGLISPHKQFGRRHSTAVVGAPGGSGLASPQTASPNVSRRLMSTHSPPSPVPGGESGPRYKRSETAPTGSRRLPKPVVSNGSSHARGAGPAVGGNRTRTESEGTGHRSSPTKALASGGAATNSGKDGVARMGSLRRRLGSFSRPLAHQESTGTDEAEASIGSPKPRSLRFTFGMNNTSSKPAKEVLRLIKKSLDTNKIEYQQESPFLVSCKYGGDIHFEMEVCKLPRLSMNGIRLRRVGGSTLGYKNIATKVLNDLTPDL